MIIVILVDWFFPGYRAGGPIRSCVNLARQLSQHHKIFIITSDRDYGMPQPYDGLPLNEWYECFSNVKVLYLSPNEQALVSLKEYINTIKPDTLYLNSVFSKVFTLFPLYLIWRKQISPQVILSPRGMLHKGALQYKPLKKKIFLQLLKWSGVLRDIRFQATDAQEKIDIQNTLSVPSDQITILENFPEFPRDQLKFIPKRTGEVRLLFLSRISPKKNLTFLLECLNGVSNAINVVCTIAGPVEDHLYWNRCQMQIAQLPPHIQIEFSGDIPHPDVPNLLEEHHFFVLPTFGENFGHSIFEAFGCGRPVILSDKTPWRNLEAQKTGWDIPLSQSDQFVRAIEKAAAMDQKEYDEWSQSAWNFAKRYIEKSDLKRRYLEFFNAKLD